eukprot:3560264-Pleurochrysis_carterae.AAC.1
MGSAQGAGGALVGGTLSGEAALALHEPAVAPLERRLLQIACEDRSKCRSERVDDAANVQGLVQGVHGGAHNS